MKPFDLWLIRLVLSLGAVTLALCIMVLWSTYLGLHPEVRFMLGS